MEADKFWEAIKKLPSWVNRVQEGTILRGIDTKQLYEVLFAPEMDDEGIGYVEAENLDSGRRYRLLLSTLEPVAGLEALGEQSE